MIRPSIHRSGQRRVFSDITFSAPRSVSIVALALRDQRVREAYRQAVRKIIRGLDK